MRAGLLSEPQVIKRINERFVSTWILKDDMTTLAKKGDKLAQQLAVNYEYPMDLMFLTSDGRLISRLNSFHDFLEIHPDVTAPQFTRREKRKNQSQVEVFMEHMKTHFGGD